MRSPFSVSAHRSAYRRGSGLALTVVLCAGYVVWSSLAAARTVAHPERHPQTTWAPCNRNSRNGRASTFRPLSDIRAAQLVTPVPEDRPDNATRYTIGGVGHVAANDYVPSRSELQRFRRARTSAGQPILEFNSYFGYVDGRDGLRHPSTDDLIQWVAHKWGIPENWLRAEFVQESFWNQFQLGDEAQVSARWYNAYPLQARVPNSRRVYESLGITQEKWIPDGSVGAGTEPLRWESTAFNLDYQAATIRFYYDNPQRERSAWGDRSYTPCQRWDSLGGWYNPYPWGNGGQQGYIREVQGNLAGRAWLAPDFIHWRPSSLPPAVKLR